MKKARTSATRTTDVRAPSGRRFVIVTGLSGSGKSHAVRALEDLGYFCVDNLPTTLIPTLARLAIQAGDIEKVAIVVDIREGHLLSSQCLESLGVTRVCIAVDLRAPTPDFTSHATHRCGAGVHQR